MARSQSFEIGIWVHYSTSSREGAARFFKDAFADSQDFLNALSLFGREMDLGEHWLAGIQTVSGRISENAAEFGLDADESYLKIFRIAEEMNFSEAYRVCWKLLSKFAHPTAMQVIGSADVRAVPHQFKVFKGLGSMFYVQAIDALSEFYSLNVPSPAKPV